MTLVAVSSVVRRAPSEEHSSFLRLVDLERGRTIFTVAVPESSSRAVDPNPRGGLRGARGVSAFGERLIVARSDRIFVVDRSGKLEQTLTDRSVGGIHDVLAEEDGVWVTATAASALFKLSWTGEVLMRWTVADDPEVAEALQIEVPPAFDDSIDYRTPSPGVAVHDRVHMNAVLRDDARLLISLGLIRSSATQRRETAKAAVAKVGTTFPPTRRILGALQRRRHEQRHGPPTHRGAQTERDRPAPTKPGSSHAIVELELGDQGLGPARVLWHQRDIATPKHNIWLHGQTLLFNDSDAGELVGVDLASGRVELKIPIPGSPSFARGLHALSDDELLIGSQRPAAIYVVRLSERSVTQKIELGGQPWETVYAICELPPSFSGDDVDGFREWAAGVWIPEEVDQSTSTGSG